MEYFEPLKLLEVGETLPYAAEVKKTPKKAEEKTQAEILKQGAAVSRFAKEDRAFTMAEDSTQPEFAKRVNAAAPSDGDLHSCPACGSTKNHRTRRTTKERMLGRPPMARCESCGMRFPYFGHHDGSPDSVKSRGAAASARHAGEEGRGSRTTADPSDQELSCCPFCGSTAYQRSRRTTLERLLLRPKMARCRNCLKRFTYPKG